MGVADAPLGQAIVRPIRVLHVARLWRGQAVGGAVGGLAVNGAVAQAGCRDKKKGLTTLVTACAAVRVLPVQCRPRRSACVVSGAFALCGAVCRSVRGLGVRVV